MREPDMFFVGARGNYYEMIMRAHICVYHYLNGAYAAYYLCVFLR